MSAPDPARAAKSWEGSRRFEQDPEPSIFLVGDVNDGPGKELLEREYLFHDLISNLQGDVFFAEKFMSHASTRLIAISSEPPSGLR
jgi:hypothetical protein